MNDGRVQTEKDETTRTDLLMTILQELRELRQERKSRDSDLNDRIKDLEVEVELIHNHIQTQGLSLESLHVQCRKRLDTCYKARKGNASPSSFDSHSCDLGCWKSVEEKEKD